MSALTHWEPFKEIEDLQTRFARFFGPAATRPANGALEFMPLAQWVPSVDISEDNQEWLVKADLPDVRKEDVKVTVENGVLTIAGDRKFEKAKKEKRYHRIERAYGSFFRSFRLPTLVQESKVSSEFRDGVLKIHLPKSQDQDKPRTVEVRVG